MANANFIKKTKHYSDEKYFLAATLVGCIGGDSAYRKVAAKNISF